MPETTQETQAIELATQHSIREFAPSVWGGLIGDGIGVIMPTQVDLIPTWGTPQCDWWLRLIDVTQHNALWSGAKQIWMEKFLSTPYEISGGRNQTYQWQDLFFESDFGEGYDFMMQKALADYLTLNRGMFLELVSYGDSDTPLQEGAKVIGINHLDAMRIVFTQNREWPFLYYSEYTNKAHQIHYTRVIHLTNQPSPNTRMMGMGKSALFNALTVANAQILLGRHQNELLNDQPPPGLVLFQNVNGEQVDSFMRQFEADRHRDGQSVYRGIMRLSGVDPTQPATVQFIPLASVPPDFSYDKYMQQHVNLLALTTGLDPQDIWPLMGQAMGTGAQSKELAAKTDIKGPGYFATRMERKWNAVLPRGLEWKYKAQNGQQDLQQANIAKVWTDLINSAGFMDETEKRQLAANQIPAFADVLLDEQGNVRLPDDDPKEQGQEIIATDNVEIDTPDDVAPEATADDETASETTTPVAETDEEKKPPAKAVHKNIDDTTSAFVSEIQAAMQDGVDKVVSKASTAARIRGAITRYGKLAYQDGLEDGGVEGSELDEDDTRIIADLNVADSVYVSDLVNEMYSESGMTGTPESRAPLWGNKTLNAFYYAGIESADKNGMYEFMGDDGKESCPDCARLKGTRHRMKWWVDKELRPGVDTDNFECGGWNCAHYLEKV